MISPDFRRFLKQLFARSAAGQAEGIRTGMTLLAPDRWKPAGFALIALALGACSGTTYGTGVSPGRQTVNDITGLVSLGSGGNKEPIEYAPRAAIVVPPPNAALPKPGEGEVAGDWPVDPDEARKAKLAAAGSKQQTDEEILSDPGFRLPKSNSVDYQDHSKDPNSAEIQMRQMKEQRGEAEKLFAKANGASGGDVDANGNPVRTTLSEPPAEYRVPDPSAPEEFTAARDEKWWQIFKKKGAPASATATPPPSERIAGSVEIPE